MYVVRQFLTEQMTRIIEDLLGYQITLLCRVEHVLRGDVIDIGHITQQRRLGRSRHDLLRRTSHTCRRSVRLDTTFLTAAAQTSVTAMIDLTVT